MPYPWQVNQWEQVRLAADRNKLAHALLLSGAAGSGIRQFALEFSHYLLCEAPVQGAACGQCHSCILCKADNHPDIRLISPEEQDSRIKVDAIRDLISYLQLSNQYGKHKIAVIEPAEGMNRHSANSLLKTLEEPAASALLILVSYQPAKLPVTLRSRCQNISFNLADREAASKWLGKQVNDPARADDLLELAGGAPLKALDMDEMGALQSWEEMLQDLQKAGRPETDPARMAEKWHKDDVTETMKRLLLLFSKMTLMRALMHSPGAGKTTRQPVFDTELRRIVHSLSLSSLLDCYDITLKNYHLLTGETNLNKQSLLEEIIVHWQSIHSNNSADNAD